MLVVLPDGQRPVLAAIRDRQFYPVLILDWHFIKELGSEVLPPRLVYSLAPSATVLQRFYSISHNHSDRISLKMLAVLEQPANCRSNDV